MQTTKKILTFITSVAALLPMQINAEETKPDTKKDSGPIGIIRVPKKITPTRKNAPSRVYVECCFAFNEIQVIFPSSAESMTITIANAASVIFHQTISAAMPSAPFTPVPGTYTITCVTNNGSTYEREITF